MNLFYLHNTVKPKSFPKNVQEYMVNFTNSHLAHLQSISFSPKSHFFSALICEPGAVTRSHTWRLSGSHASKAVFAM